MFKFLLKKSNQDNLPQDTTKQIVENRVLESKIELLKIEKQEQYESFIAILNQIQELNNTKEKGKGNFIKGFSQRKLSINNMIDLAKESYEQKIKELD